tara:strand:+ start:89 stop:1084 length:996 start_codon:yes stop_codon:yes gene_type:complete
MTDEKNKQRKKFDKEKIINDLDTAYKDSKEPSFNKITKIIKKYKLTSNQIKYLKDDTLSLSDHLSVGVDSILDGYIENPSELENIGKDHKTEPPKPNIISNKKEGLQTVKHFGWDLDTLSKKLRKDKEIVLEAVKGSGAALEYADDSLKKDKEIVLEAVNDDGDALQYADDSLKKNKEIVNLAIKNKIGSIKYADPSLRKDINYIIKFLKREKYKKDDYYRYIGDHYSAFQSIFREFDRDVMDNSKILEIFKKTHKDITKEEIDYFKKSKNICKELKEGLIKSDECLCDGIEKIIKKNNISLNELKEIRPIFDDVYYVLRLDDMIQEWIDE